MLHVLQLVDTRLVWLAGSRVDGSAGASPYKAVSDLHWSAQDNAQGKTIKIHGFPGSHKVKLFWVVTDNSRTEWIVINDIDQASAEDTREICAILWKIEQYNREVKQVLGIEKCQCRSARAQRGCVILAWNHLTAFARKLKTTSNLQSQEENAFSLHEMLSNLSVPMSPV